MCIDNFIHAQRMHSDVMITHMKCSFHSAAMCTNIRDGLKLNHKFTNTYKIGGTRNLCANIKFIPPNKYRFSMLSGYMIYVHCKRTCQHGVEKRFFLLYTYIIIFTIYHVYHMNIYVYWKDHNNTTYIL